jgi:hypothetical protein
MSEHYGTLVAVPNAEPTMARPDAPAVESVAATILQHCLVQDGSILTPDRQIWTPTNLAELQTRYVKAPDPSAQKFEQKLAIQLADASPVARQLFAEIHILNVLPASNFRPATKAGYINDVLAPIQPPVTLTPEVVHAFDGGVFHGGRAWSSRRWAQLSFLIDFADYFKQLDQAAREQAAVDPALMRTLVMDSPGHPEPGQRHALLYLFFPRYYLPVIAGQHRQWLRDGFQEYLPDGRSDDIDADLRIITDTVEAEEGGPVDWYASPWRERWWPETTQPPTPPTKTDSPDGESHESDEDVHERRPYTVADMVNEGCFHAADRLQRIIEHWRDTLCVVLEGSPGTGKSWAAKRLAQALVGADIPGTIRAVQFHPNTSYEDFVRGWRPNSQGQLTLSDGALLQHAERARTNPDIPHILIIEEINRGNPAQAFGEMLTLIEKSKRNQRDRLTLSYPAHAGEEYFLPPNLYLLGTMNIADRSLALVDLALRRRFAFERLEPAFTGAWADYLAAKLPKNLDLVDVIAERIGALNATIADDPSLGPQFAVGHSFVTPSDTQSDGLAWYHGVIETQIGPQLREYWFDERAKADAAIAALKP